MVGKKVKDFIDISYDGRLDYGWGELEKKCTFFISSNSWKSAFLIGDCLEVIHGAIPMGRSTIIYRARSRKKKINFFII